MVADHREPHSLVLFNLRVTYKVMGDAGVTFCWEGEGEEWYIASQEYQAEKQQVLISGYTVT